MHEQYILQGIMKDIIICFEDSYKQKDVAVGKGENLLKAADFEGDSVRVITSDGELVWESRRQQA